MTPRGNRVSPAALVWRALAATDGTNPALRNPAACRQNLAGLFGAPDRIPHVIADLRGMVSLTSVHCAVRPSVRGIFRGRSPSQVARAVVGLIAIAMRYMATRFVWLWAMKRAGHKPMNIMSCDLLTAAKPDLHVSSRHLGLPQKCRTFPHSAESGNFIVGRAFNCAPYFWRVFKVSHSAVPSRVWSGPRDVASIVSGPFYLAKFGKCSKGGSHALSAN
jgi:hypothetical protein